MITIAIAFFALLSAMFGMDEFVIPILLMAAITAFVNAYDIYRDNKRYKESEYYLITHNPRDKVKRDRGLNGEYKIYDKLRDFEGRKRFLFNLYLPKDDGETTEIDVIMIHESGIYVFESKNYSGWIFGSEYQKSWTQTLPGRRGRAHREYFMNPIAQNKLHLKWLEKALADDSLTIHSYIVFGSDCKLKNVTLKDGDHHVLRVDDLLDEVRINAHDEGYVMSEDLIDAVYSRLVGYCMVDESVKKAHVENIRRKKNGFREKEPNVFENSSTKSFDDNPKTADTNEQPATDVETRATTDKVDESQTETATDAHAEQQSEVQVDKQPERSEQPHRESGERLCPLCGSKLVIRRASRGENKGHVFWGCSAFPKCRYSEKIPIAGSDDTGSGG